MRNKNEKDRSKEGHRVAKEKGMWDREGKTGVL